MVPIPDIGIGEDLTAGAVFSCGMSRCAMLPICGPIPDMGRGAASPIPATAAGGKSICGRMFISVS